MLRLPEALTIPLDLDDAAFGWGQPGKVGGIQPEWQGPDPVVVGQDVDLSGPGPDPHGAAGHGRAEPDLLPGDPKVARRRHHPVQFHGPGRWLLAIGPEPAANRPAGVSGPVCGRAGLGGASSVGTGRARAGKRWTACCGPDNADSNTAADLLAALDLAPAQLPAPPLQYMHV